LAAIPVVGDIGAFANAAKAAAEGGAATMDAVRAGLDAVRVAHAGAEAAQALDAARAAGEDIARGIPEQLGHVI
jgi:hypothetical protein